MFLFKKPCGRCAAALPEAKLTIMAIFNLTASIGSRTGGASASAKFDYIAREGEYARDGFELREKESGNMPSWAAESPREYWTAADEYERANGRLYREVHVALPVELDADAQRALARRLAQDLAAAERLPYTLAIHEGEGRNPHAHVMWSERGNDGRDRSAETWFKRANTKDPVRGGARKSVAANSRDWLPGLREQWAERVNDALARSGREERVDHRSLAARAEEAMARGDEDLAAELAREPNVHLGPAAVQSIERQTRGKPPMRKLEAAAEVERRNGVWAEIERQYRQVQERLHQQLLALRRELRELTRRQREVERALGVERERQRDLVAALREHEALVKAGRYEDAGQMARQVINRELPYSNVDQDARDRYNAVSDLRRKRSLGRAFDRTESPPTNDDINRRVAEHYHDRDYGPSR